MRFIAILLLLIPFFSSSQDINHATVSIKLLEQIELQPANYQPILILLEDRVDIQSLINEFESQNISQDRRPKILIETLQNKAQNTQGALLDFLQSSPYLLEYSLKSFWISNIIYAKAQPELIAELSNRNDVAWIGWSAPLKTEAVEVAPAFVQPNSIEPGLEVVGAPFMWNLGYTGYGQLAFTNDTGIDRFHPTYESKYRGLYSELESVWFDYDEMTMAAIPGAEPRDCNGHGTHVNGTILGLDRQENDTIGVAFNAQWIGAAILCGIGTADNVASFEWSLNPDGNIDTFDDIPDIINNSWYDPSLDTLDCVSVYVPILEAMEAANIAVIFSAGNEGPNPMTITQPHNININLVNTFTVGALNGNNASLPIANFSSRGPSHCGGDSSLLIKPEVSAPGVSVRSARPNGTYGNLSGTSMASPHAAGCVLLLREAFPDVSAKKLKEALYYTCIDLGETGEDNTFGMGVINVENAYNYLLDLGYIPVSPYKNNDVLLIDFQTSDAACENEIGGEIFVENAGTDSLFSFQINYEAAGVSQTYNWDGVLAAAERTVIKIPPILISDGEHSFKIELLNPNNVSDERPLNNRLERIIPVTSRPYVQAEIINSDAICQNSRALIQGNYPNENVKEYLWYNAAFGGNLLETGNFYLTDGIIENTTVYASAIFNENFGEEAFAPDSMIEFDSMGIGLEFDAHSDFILKSVLVNIPESGVRQIILRDFEDHSLTNKTFIPELGLVRVELNFNVPKGKGHKLQLNLGKPFSTSTQPSNYPYQVDGVCTINKSLNFDEVHQFPIFLDWEIEYENPCNRTPVFLEVQENENLPTVDFSPSKDTLNLFLEEGIVEFLDNSDAVVEWLWHFDNLGESNVQNPSFEFTEIGEYQIALTVFNDEGCSNSLIKTIVIIDENPTSVSVLEEITNILVYPNPFSNNLQIVFDLNKNQPVKIKLFDAVGRMIKERKGQFMKENLEWSLTDLENGVYYLMFELEGKIITKRVVKI